MRDRGNCLDREEQEAMEEMQADKLLSDGTVELQTALSSGSKVDSQAAKVACLMIETAKANQVRQRANLKQSEKNKKEVNKKKNQKLLEKALPTRVSAPPSKKRKPN